MSIPDRLPSLDPDAVREFVIAGHGDLEAVRRTLDAEPAMVNACWDWGGGDWETALGGASHMGRRDIALFLIERGARMDIFAAAMLGKTEIVRSMLDSFPALRDAEGPHGIPLAKHAEMGGEQASEVLELLSTTTAR
jgi:hypothetical protein